MRYLAASILWCICTFAQAPDVKPDDKCSVEGTVLNSATGEPVKKARVTLAPIGHDQEAFATTTDASGHFLIDEVDAGRYSLTAARNGYTQPKSVHGSTKDRALFTFDKGQKMKEVVVTLAPEGVIAGRVLDEEGDPVAYVAIQCMSVGYGNGKHKLIAQAGTNANDLGEFRLPGLTAGKYIVSAVFQAQNIYGGVVLERPVRTPGQAAEEAFVTTYYPRTMNPNSASAIEVSPGAQINGITLTPMRARTVHIKGRVGATTQVHALQILLGLYPRDEVQSGVSHMGAPVAPHGDFQLMGVVPGSYILHASCITRDGKAYSARMLLEVHDSNIEGIDRKSVV